MSEKRLIPDGALEFYTQKMGWQLFPIKPGEKSPPLVLWQTEASKNLEKVTSWWNEYPRANVGLRCGVTSGVVVIDVDPIHTGDDSLFELFAKYERFPDTVVALSGGGGTHYFFKHPITKIPSRNGYLAPGIDVKADGGYVLLPPSIHPNGTRYEWEPSSLPTEVTVADLPEWLFNLIKEDDDRSFSKKRNLPLDENEPFVSGTRNEMLTSLAGSMRRRGMSQEAIVEALIKENEKKCVPPLSDFEVATIAESVSRYKPQEVPRGSAMVVSGRRAQLEWLFGAAAYTDPVLAIRMAGWLDENTISSDKLKIFWRRIKEGHDRVEVANDIGILPDLMEWTSKLSSVNEVESLARQVSRNSYVDDIAVSLPDLSQAVASADVEKIRKIIEGMESNTPNSGHKTKDADQSLDEFTALVDRMDERAIPSFISSLDDKLGGFEKQTLTVIGARPGAGKTTIAWQIARSVARNNKKVIFFSLEMSAAALWAKAASGASGVRWRDFRAGKCTELQISMLKKAASDFKNLYRDTLFIDDTPMTTDVVWQIVSEYSPDFVVVDHLRLLKDFYGDLKEDKRLGYTSQRLKELAKFFSIPVLCLAQLNRSVEGRDNKRPHLSDLRDSGQIEENADNVLMLYRDDYYEDDRTTLPDQEYSPTEVLIRKIRDDIAGQSCTLQFKISEQWFYDTMVAERERGSREEF